MSELCDRISCLELVVCAYKSLQTCEAGDVFQIAQSVVANIQRIKRRKHFQAIQAVQNVLLRISARCRARLSLWTIARYCDSTSAHLQTFELAERWQPFQRFKSVTLQEEGFKTSVRFQVRNVLKALKMQIKFVVERRRSVQLGLLAYIPQRAWCHLHNNWIARDSNLTLVTLIKGAAPHMKLLS